MSGPVGGVLLAAGEGKRLVEIGGQRLVDRGAAVLRDGGASPVVVVAGAVDVTVGNAATVHNPDWRTGMASSLAAGLLGLPADCAAAVIALVDQPLIGAAAVARLIAAFRAGAGAAVATYAGSPRNPVLLAREHWPAVLAAADGDSGARGFLRTHPELVTAVECGDTGSPDDVDTPDDLARVSRLLAARQPGKR
jgi:nicotine blue oxidoreductase